VGVEFQPGQTLLHYRIIEKVGQGGMGEVYAAEDLKLGRRVAMKMLPAGARQDSKARKRLLQEARSASALNHPNIVTIHAIEEVEGIDILVMEYVEGESLRARLQRGPLELPELLDLGIQAANALAEAHSAGLTHRDIKPANIMWTPAGRVKVLDFGLAKMGEGGGLIGHGEDTLSQHLTERGAVVGTVAYMSPEQTRSEPVDGRSDIFSLGGVLYEAATGRLPFRGPSVLAVFHDIATAEPPRPSALRPELPPELDQIILRAMAKDREQRYRSAPEVRPAGAALPVLDRRPEAFVGRDLEMARLEQALARALQGSGTTVFLAGEPGIGKTSLAAEFLRRLRQAYPDVLVARGACVEQYGTGEPYLPFLDALGGLLAGPARDRLAGTLRRYAPTWCLQFPSTFASSGALEQLQRETIGATKERMLRELGDALDALTPASPLVLLLEDLHWADPSSVDLLRHLGPRAASQRLLLLGTFRPEEIEQGPHPLRNCLREMVAHQLGHEVRLATLGEDHVQGYLDARFSPNDFPAELAGLVYRKTEGHPLFVSGAVQLLSDRGELVQVDQRWTLARPVAELDLEVPESVRGMIGKKIEALEQEDRRTLEYASIEGEEFTSTLLAALLGVEELALEERLAHLERVHGLVHSIAEEELPDGSLATRYRFGHALYQNILYGGLLSKRRALLHRQAGEELLRRYGKLAGRVAAPLATHFERGRDPSRAVQYLIQAGDNALQVYANAVAVQHYTRALALVERLAPGEQAAARLKAYHKRAAAHLSVGQVAEAVQDYTRMLEAARGQGDSLQECLALNGLAETHLYTHQMAEMEARAGEALRIADSIGNHALRTEAILSLALNYQTTGRLEEAHKMYDQVIAGARAEGHRQALVRGLTFFGLFRFFQTRYQESEGLLVEAMGLASELRHGLMLPLSHFYRGLTLANLGRMSEALSSLHEANEIAKRNNNLLVLSRVPNGIGWIYRELGDYQRAAAYDQAGVEASRKIGSTEAEANALINLAHLRTQAGDSDATRDILRNLDAIQDRDPWNQWRFFGIRMQHAAAEYWLAQGELDKAGEHAGRLLHNARTHGVPKYIGVARTLLAGIAEARGDLAGAEAELAAAVEALRENPAPLAAWKAWAAMGRLRTKAGRAAAAREAFGEAAAIVTAIANSVAEEALRRTFLESATVQEVLRGAG
jgi:tetratricopeptide (TPR) repeat protein